MAEHREAVDPACIIADLLSSTLMPVSNWDSARAPYIWEREGLDYLLLRKQQGDRPPINDWTAMLVDEGYPAARAGARQGQYWSPTDG